MSAGSFADFISAIGQEESGGNYAWVSSAGYIGKFQFGEEALQAVGFYDGDSAPQTLDFSGGWTALAASYGITSKASFLASPAGQDAAESAWLAKAEADIVSLGLKAYEGHDVAGIHITDSGLLAGVSAVGVWALKDFLVSGGAVDPTEYYGTPVSTYLREFGGYDTPWTAAAAGPSGLSLAGGAGDDTLSGGAGADTITGGDGRNLLTGADGADSIQGGAGPDTINGNQGADTLHGGAGDDIVFGGQGDDQLFGDDGADWLNGNKGDDTVYGGAGNNTLYGGQGDDSLVGGAGNDWLSGDRGTNVLFGGAGADTFHAGLGVDRVLDFHAAEGDHVQLDPGAAYQLAQVGADAVITLAGGGQMTLVGVELSTLPSGWIFEG